MLILLWHGAWFGLRKYITFAGRKYIRGSAIEGEIANTRIQVHGSFNMTIKNKHRNT